MRPQRPRPITGQFKACLDACLDKALNGDWDYAPEEAPYCKLPGTGKGIIAQAIIKASKEKQAAAAAQGNKPGDAKDKGKAIGDQMKQKIQEKVKKEVIEKAAAAGDANAAAKVNNPVAGTTPAAALTPKPGSEPQLKVPSSKLAPKKEEKGEKKEKKKEESSKVSKAEQEK